jgi:hypothetical protein
VIRFHQWALFHAHKKRIGEKKKNPFFNANVKNIIIYFLVCAFGWFSCTIHTILMVISFCKFDWILNMIFNEPIPKLIPSPFELGF